MSPQTAWGSATETKSGGGDPNVLKLGDQNRVRLLDAEGPRKWRQHGLDGKVLHLFFPAVDESHFSNVTCPRGPDGSSNAVCPCDMKSSYIDPETGKDEQLFPVSIRYAANVWDYESDSVRVLIGGKQIFEAFDAVAKVGFDPTGADFIIFKSGKDRQTSYKVVRGKDEPLPREIKPEDLHDLDKYEAPTSADRIFEKLAEIGVDYDAIPVPEFTVDQAMQFVMPYTKKAKGLTLEQLAATDLDFMKWLYGTKREQGQYGDAVFQAMHAVLLHMGETTPLDELPKAPPRAQTKAPPAAPATATSNGHPENMDTITLIGPDGASTEVPAAAKDALLAAGFTEPAPPAPQNPGNTTLVGPDGAETDAGSLTAEVVTALLAAGFSWKVPDAEVGAWEPADGDQVLLDIGGTKAMMDYAQAKGLVTAGAATLIGPAGGEPAPAPAAPAFSVDPDAKIDFKLKVIPTPVSLTFRETVPIFMSGQGTYVGDDAVALSNHAERFDAGDDQAVAAQAATGAEAMDPPQAAATSSTDKALTEGPNPAGKFTHPALPGKEYATKGAVTQALNRLGASAPSPSASPSGAPDSSASAPAAGAEGREGKLQEAKDLLSKAGGYMDDFDKLMGLFNDVAGKRNISEFTEPELDKLVARLQAEAATA